MKSFLKENIVGFLADNANKHIGTKNFIHSTTFYRDVHRYETQWGNGSSAASIDTDVLNSIREPSVPIAVQIMHMNSAPYPYLLLETSTNSLYKPIGTYSVQSSSSQRDTRHHNDIEIYNEVKLLIWSLKYQIRRAVDLKHCPKLVLKLHIKPPIKPVQHTPNSNENNIVEISILA